MSNLSVSRTVLWIRLFRQSFYHMHIKGEVRTHHFKHTTNNSSLCSQQKQRKFSHDDEQCDPVALKSRMLIHTRNRHTLAHARRNTAFHIIYGVFGEQSEGCQQRSLITVCVTLLLSFNMQDKDPICVLSFSLQQIMHHKRSYAVSTRGEKNPKIKKKTSLEFLFYW